VGWLEVDLGLLFVAPRRPSVYQTVSRFPSADRDLAFVVDASTPAASLEGTLRDAAGDLLVDLRLFDVYRDERLGADKRSLAWRLRFNAADRTLTDDEVDNVTRACIEAVERLHPAQLRS
jgi:phenylalanyl-tRNA synthetase beta chain